VFYIKKRFRDYKFYPSKTKTFSLKIEKQKAEKHLMRVNISKRLLLFKQKRFSRFFVNLTNK